jgi:hypothetical protein
MKAVTPLISVILLLLITIAMVGFTYTWFTRVSADVTNQTSSAIEDERGKRLVIDDVLLNTNVYLRNIGTKSIGADEVQFYINNAPAACDFGITNFITPGETVTCTLASQCNVGSILKATFPSGSDLITCP